MLFSTHRKAAGLLCLLIGLTACSSSDSNTAGDYSTTVEGLSAPDQVSVVTANGEEEGSENGGLVAPATTGFPADSDYFQDSTSSHVYDPSMEALQQVNTILCYLSMTAYDEMVNRGAYVAQIDTSLCESGEDNSSAGSDQGQSSGAGASTFEYFTVQTTRANDQSQQLTSIWVPQEDGGPGSAGAGSEPQEETIYVQLQVDEAATRDDPLGSFSMRFAGAPSFELLEDSVLTGAFNTIETADEIAYQFYESFGDVSQPAQVGDFARQVRLAVTMDGEMANGVARVNIAQRFNWGDGDSGIQEENWRMAFNPTHFKRQANDGPETTLSRDDFNESVWRYNLYYNTGENAGQRVELNSGFPFETEDGLYGWAGYWGLWAPEEAELSWGDTIYRQQYGSNSPGEAYTVVTSPGKLIRNERFQLAVAELTGTNLQFWDWQTGSQFLVEYSAGSFFEVASFDDETGTWTEITPVLLDPDVYGGFLSFWSDSLGGQVNWVDGDDFVTYYKETFVTGADEVFDSLQSGELTLYGLVDALDAELSASDAEQGNVFLPPAETVLDAYTYAFRVDDLRLYLEQEGQSLAVGLATGQEPESGPFTWGMRSGPLVTSLDGITDPWDVWSADVFYVYETGHNQWNGFTGLQDSTGSFVEFDAPVQFLYTHSTENDRNGSSSFDGQSFFLDYNGDGGLHGIPFEPSGAAGVDDFQRWYPVFNIADGVELGPNGDDFVIKAMEIELSLVEDSSGSQALQLAGADLLTLPDPEDFVLPTIGEKPEVNEAPAVLNGEVLGGED